MCIECEVFLRTSVPDPLLCLTVSATLRENILPSARSAKHPLANLIAAAGGLPVSDTSAAITSNGVQANDDDTLLDFGGLEEVNLLDGLTGGDQSAFTSVSLNIVNLPTFRSDIRCKF